MTAKHAAALPVPQEERKDRQTTEKEGNEVRGKRIVTQFHILLFCDVCVCVSMRHSVHPQKGGRGTQEEFSDAWSGLQIMLQSCPCIRKTPTVTHKLPTTHTRNTRNIQTFSKLLRRFLFVVFVFTIRVSCSEVSCEMTARLKNRSFIPLQNESDAHLVS